MEVKIAKFMGLCGLALVLAVGCKPDSKVPEGYDAYGNRLVRSMVKHLPYWDWIVEFRYDEEGWVAGMSEVVKESGEDGRELARMDYILTRSGHGLEAEEHIVFHDLDGYAKGLASLLGEKRFFLEKSRTKASLGGWDTSWDLFRYTLNGEGFVAEGWNRYEGEEAFDYMDGQLQRVATDESGLTNYTWVEGDLRAMESTLFSPLYEMAYTADTNKTNVDMSALLDGGMMRKGMLGMGYVGLFRYLGEKSVCMPQALSLDGILNRVYSYSYDKEGLPVRVEVRDGNGEWMETWEFAY